MKKLWIVFLVAGIGLAAAAGIIMFQYVSQMNSSEDVMADLRSMKAAAVTSVPADAVSEGDTGTSSDVTAPDAAATEIGSSSDTSVPDTATATGSDVSGEVNPSGLEKPGSETAVSPEKPGTEPVIGTTPSIDESVPAGTEEGAQTAPSATEAAPTEAPIPSPTPFVLTEDIILPEYLEMYRLNNDLVGWLTIDGTIIDYPVMQSEESSYYLSHNFYDQKNSNGTLVLDSGSDMFLPSQVLMIHGHNMNSGKMFHSLLDYAKESYGKSHMTISLDTLTEHRTYTLVAAFYSKIYDDDEPGFRYNVIVSDKDTADYFVAGLKYERRYDTGVEFDSSDQFIVLSTCAYHTKNGRFVVVGVRTDTRQ